MKHSQVITGQDNNVLNGPVLGVAQQPGVLPDGIGGTLEPLLLSGSLGSSQDLNETITTEADTATHVVSTGEVTVQRSGVELGQNVNLADAAVDAVAHRHIDQAVSTTDGDGRLSTAFGQGEQTGASTTTENDSCTRQAWQYWL